MTIFVGISANVPLCIVQGTIDNVLAGCGIGEASADGMESFDGYIYILWFFDNDNLRPYHFKPKISAFEQFRQGIPKAFIGGLQVDGLVGGDDAVVERNLCVLVYQVVKGFFEWQALCNQADAVVKGRLPKASNGAH